MNEASNNGTVNNSEEEDSANQNNQGDSQQESETQPVSANIVLSDYVGDYEQTGTENSFYFTGDQFTKIKVIHPVYGNEDRSYQEISSMFNDSELNNNTLNTVTTYGCNFVAVFNSDGSITLTISMGDESFNGTFVRKSATTSEATVPLLEKTFSSQESSATIMFTNADAQGYPTIFTMDSSKHSEYSISNFTVSENSDTVIKFSFDYKVENPAAEYSAEGEYDIAGKTLILQGGVKGVYIEK